MENIGETEVAEVFFGSVIKNVDEMWPEIYKQLKEVFTAGDGFNVENENDAKMNLVFAVIALEMETLKKLYPNRVEIIYAKAFKLTSLSKEHLYIKISF